jgi:hypothetical protein
MSHVSRWLLLVVATALLTGVPRLERWGLPSGEAIVLTATTSVPETHHIPAGPNNPCPPTPNGQGPHGNPCHYVASCTSQLVSTDNYRLVLPVSVRNAVTPAPFAAPRSRAISPASPPPKA